MNTKLPAALKRFSWFPRWRDVVAFGGAAAMLNFIHWSAGDPRWIKASIISGIIVCALVVAILIRDRHKSKLWR